MFGGLIVGMVVKYADNILKNFANALSVIFTVLGAIPLFEQYPSAWFIVGVAAVLLSVFMYGKATPPVRARPHPGLFQGVLGFCSLWGGAPSAHQSNALCVASGVLAIGVSL